VFCSIDFPGEVNLTEEEEGILEKDGNSLERACKDVVGSMNSKGDEILRGIRCTFKTVFRNYKAQSGVADLLNHKAFKLYADVDAPKALLEQFNE